jgi:lipooligosaccharide transport system ATP-binding protein
VSAPDLPPGRPHYATRRSPRGNAAGRAGNPFLGCLTPPVRSQLMPSRPATDTAATPSMSTPTSTPAVPAATGPSSWSDGNGGALVQASGLTKRFGRHTAVDGIDFAVARGEVFGFLGPNGAGKTSTMRMIGCVSAVSAGSLRVLGLDPSRDGAAIRARLGVVPQLDNLDLELTVWDNMLIYGRYFGLPVPVIRERAVELLTFARLDDRRDSKVDPLSGGMKRRLTIARALINRPELLLLDEPTTGLDPQARHMLWERLYGLKREGVTQVLTTHYMDEAEQLCDRLVIMDEGRIVAEGSPRSLIERYSTREVVELRFTTPAEQDAAVPRLDGAGERVEPVADRVLVYSAHGDDTVAALGARDVHPDSVLVRRSSLEDVFLLLTGRSLDE